MEGVIKYVFQKLISKQTDLEKDEEHGNVAKCGSADLGFPHQGGWGHPELHNKDSVFKKGGGGMGAAGDIAQG